MGLHWGAPVLETLMPPEQWHTLQSLQVDPSVPTKDEDFLQFLNGQTGELIGRLPANKFFRLRRSQLRACLMQGLDVQFGKILEKISFPLTPDASPRVTVEFRDGSKRSGCLVVGADGAKSTVRRLLLGHERSALMRLPFAATFVQSRYSRNRALFLRQFHPLYLAAPHPLGRFAFFGMHNVENASDPESWTFFMYISWPWTAAQQDESKGWTNKQKLDQVRKLAEDYTDPWKSAFEWLQDDTPVWHLGLKVWDPTEEEHRWDNNKGRVTLAGDAAHPMTYRTLMLDT